MPREVMRRQAGDNVYLHRDFHGALSGGIEYLDQRYGPEAVRDYLRGFVLSYYAPLRERIAAEGLEALRQHFADLHATEGGDATITLTGDEVVIEVAVCPAVTHMRQYGYPVARLWVETTRTVNEALCEGTPFAAELLEYDEQTGRSLQRFYRRDGA